MNNNNYLPTDLMSLILSIRTEEMKKDLDKKIEEWKGESEIAYIYLTNEIDEYFIEELEGAKLFSPFQVLKQLREEREIASLPLILQ